MAELPFVFSVRATEALEKIQQDAQGAADALLIAAEYIQSGTPLPNDLSRWLCGAIEKSMCQPKAKRGDALLLELGFTRHHRRKAAQWYAVGTAFDYLVDQGESQNQAASQVAVDFKISESTAVRCWQKYQEARRLHDEALRNEGLSDYDPWYD
ncbi:hypothetical protein BN873_150315 [Candidatus Competibacter denitrificans Run_A_D11]|uniref:Uncharacterized protein n=1 Tax=Candidatus Competibacter denitrificans Run_A_D11 TaxID=1400863 RepID=W6M249_9GAMM|nr:hypothetical protein [Candidatus Competibacter denitrificans]CDI01527.1 hypothetical protein BN873_150315 [Candidatus Competibacter denitrificans Run_A_D11]HAS86881.1 hypothetical protein [Candidatus Competibacteraceae bacterium]HRC68583.1 hypothetical protein [Candidatus Competibacter denitrificans]